MSLVMLASLVIGCQTGRRPFMQVQFCLTKTADANELRRVLRSIAAEEHMEFLDWSKETQELMEPRKSLPPKVQRSFPIINVGVSAEDGRGVTGGNAGLPADQVLLGFGQSGDTFASRQFAERVTKRLQEHWRLHSIPGERGAVALTDCP